MMNMNFSWVIEGKLAGHMAPSSEQDLEWLKEQGILALVRMAEEYKARVDKQKVEQMGLLDYHEPIPDFTAPNLVQINQIVQFIESSLVMDKPVGVSCGTGLGRTGTILACYLVRQGYEAPAAIKEVRSLRPGSIETDSQEDTVKSYYKNGG